MTSTPEDGELGQRHAEQDADQTNLQDEAYFGPGPELNGDDEYPDEADELPNLGQDDILEEEQRAQDLDEADTIPRDATRETLSSHKISLKRLQAASVDDSVSTPDDSPSVRDSGPSSPRSDALSSQPVTGAGIRSNTPPRRPFDLRFQSRLSSSPLASPRASSPAFLHSRQSSLASLAVQSVASDPGESTAPWEVIRWTRMGKLTNQSFSEAGRRNFGSPTCLVVTENIVVGTSRGMILIFDHQQSIKAIIGSGTKALECGAVASLAVSADHTTIAAGHKTGHIFTWEIARSSKPFLHIQPIDGEQAESRKGDGHITGSAVLHVGFLGFRRTALVSADDRGMAFSHLASRGTGALGRSVKTTRVLGKYPEVVVRTSRPTKKSSVLAFAPLPLGNVEQKTDTMGLVAMLTPYLLVVVSTTPIAQTQHKAARPREVSAHGAMTAALAWFPAIKLKGNDTDVSRSKLAYAWSDVLTVLEVHEIASDEDDEEEEEKDKPPELQFLPRNRFKAEEAIVAVQWLSRSVIAVLTITQQLLIIEDVNMTVTDSFDLLPKDIYHIDVYSHQLQAVVESLDDEDTSMHGVVADAFHMSFRTYKGRLYLLCFKSLWWGSLTNWADRLIAMMDAGDFIGAIRLATSYYAGVGERLTIGLPENAEQRAGLVREKLLDMMTASLKYAFGKNQIAQTGQLDGDQLKELAVACMTACLALDDQDFLFEEIFPWYDDHDNGPMFVDVLESHILDGTVNSLPPPVIKTLINHFKVTHTLAQLEEIICLLDPTMMDIDQVTTLCKQNNLYDAYIYVWNTAVRDYVGPLKELIDLISDTSMTNGKPVTTAVAQETAHKIFAYLSFILTGRAYPTGDLIDEPDSSTAKLQIYEFLFSGNNRDALRDADLTETYPSLRTILSFDAASFMRALNEAFEDSFLNDDDMINGSAGDYSHVKIYTRQYIVQILLAVMSTGFDAYDSIYLDMFIGRNLPKYPQYMLLSGTDLHETFMRLCHYQDEGLRDDAQLSVEYLLTAYHPPEILKLVPVLQKAQFYRVLKSVFRQERQYAGLVETYFSDPDGKDGIFDVIRECMRDGSTLTEQQKAEIAQVVEDHAQDLLEIDITKAALTNQAVLGRFHSLFLQVAADDTWCQFRYLRALIEPQLSSTVSSSTEARLDNEMTELYVRLMCQYDPAHVVEYVKVVKEDDLRLESVVPAMESSGIVDAAVILLTRQGQIRDAMNRLLKHLEVIKAALKGIIESAQDSPDHMITNEGIEDLLESISKYTSVGIWICQGQKPRSAAKSPKKSSGQQPLTFDETLWLDMIVCVVGIAQEILSASSLEKTGVEKIQTSLRSVVQRLFTALLSTTTSSREGSRVGSDFTFLRILRSFLTRAAETSPTLSELRGVIATIFSAYAYEESLLALSNAMLDKDLFVRVDEVGRLRRQGWRPRGQICEICRRRVWGPGTGLRIWDAWETSEDGRQASRMAKYARATSPVDEDAHHGKGKAAVHGGPQSMVEERENPSEDTKNDLGSLVVFSCRHLYHKNCLIENGELEQEGAQTGSSGAGDQGRPLRCPSCP